MNEDKGSLKSIEPESHIGCGEIGAVQIQRSAFLRVSSVPDVDDPSGDGRFGFEIVYPVFNFVVI